MSWSNGTDDEEFVIHEPVPPKHNKVLGELRREIIELSLFLAIGRRLDIVDENTLSERKIYVARAQAVVKAMEGEKAHEPERVP